MVLLEAEREVVEVDKGVMASWVKESSAIEGASSINPDASVATVYIKNVEVTEGFGGRVHVIVPVTDEPESPVAEPHDVGDDKLASVE